MTFEERYKALNPAQKEAVDTIDGPVMVVAGPGTGKTELLSVRVANILRRSDALPGNILCLTFTESGAYAMRERLAGLIGADAYKVAVHTFHSFGSEIINQYAQYFYNGASFRPADELSSYEVLRSIFEKLPHSSRLSSTMNAEYTYLRDTQSALSDIKKSGLTSDELLAILDRNDAFVQWLQPKLQQILSARLSKKSIPLLGGLASEVTAYSEPSYELITYQPLHELLAADLTRAVEQAETDDSTKPLSAWKKAWCEKRADGELTLKDAKRSEILRAVAGVYYEYLVAMQEKGLFDFDDMILRVVHATEVFDELRYNLQEQYQYILVDEFQDTNDAQMRLIWNLTNNPSSEGRPNIMVVGDDDQAIYRFQGANLSNILDFHTLYRDVRVVTLKDNYRSTADILGVARAAITKAEERLEHRLEGVDKSLTAHQTSAGAVEFTSYDTLSAELQALAKRVHDVQTSHPDRTQAIVARTHRQLRAVLPYLQANQVSYSYEQRENALDAEPVAQLELVARVVDYLGHQRFDEVNALLPELLAHPAWGIAPAEVLKLSIAAYRDRRFWLELMLHEEGHLRAIAEWLVVAAHVSLSQPLEYILDTLVGAETSQIADSAHDESDPEDDEELEGFRSPLREWFFDTESLKKDPGQYLSFLGALSTLRHKLREFRPNQPLKLHDFVEFIDMHRQLGIPINTSTMVEKEGPVVELLTAHKSKGLEYDYVHVVGLSDATWGETARSRAKLISYPHNLPIGMGSDSSDERIRLLFVALTRAKSHLHLSYHTHEQGGKESLPVAYLDEILPTHHSGNADDIQAAELLWHERLLHIEKSKLSELLSHTLSRYKLSATHLGNYLDVTRGGPELFLIQNLLRFPQAMSPSAAFGSSVHAVLQKAHSALSATGKKRPVEDLLADFDHELERHHLSSEEFEYFSGRGADVLSAFFAARYDTFTPTQQVERSFGSETVTLGEARLTGALDLIDIDETTKTIVVTDYKTGKATKSWQGRTPYEKLKLHHYRQQLLFYKLLVENSRQFAGYTVTKGVIEFVEPASDGSFCRLELEYDKNELEEFSKLIGAVWARIQALHFSLENEYTEDLSGVLAFEKDLRQAS